MSGFRPTLWPGAAWLEPRAKSAVCCRSCQTRPRWHRRRDSFSCRRLTSQSVGLFGASRNASAFGCGEARAHVLEEVLRCTDLTRATLGDVGVGQTLLRHFPVEGRPERLAAYSCALPAPAPHALPLFFYVVPGTTCSHRLILLPLSEGTRERGALGVSSLASCLDCSLAPAWVRSCEGGANSDGVVLWTKSCQELMSA